MVSSSAAPSSSLPAVSNSSKSSWSNRLLIISSLQFRRLRRAQVSSCTFNSLGIMWYLRAPTPDMRQATQHSMHCTERRTHQ